MTRIFKVESEETSEEMKRRIGALICEVIKPYLVQIISLEQHPEKQLQYTLTLSIVGVPTEISKHIMKEK